MNGSVVSLRTHTLKRLILNTLRCREYFGLLPSVLLLLLRLNVGSASREEDMGELPQEKPSVRALQSQNKSSMTPSVGRLPDATPAGATAKAAFRRESQNGSGRPTQYALITHELAVPNVSVFLTPPRIRGSLKRKSKDSHCGRREPSCKVSSMFPRPSNCNGCQLFLTALTVLLLPNPDLLKPFEFAVQNKLPFLILLCQKLRGILSQDGS